MINITILKKFVMQNRRKIRIYVIRRNRSRKIDPDARSSLQFLPWVFFFLIHHSSLHFERKHPRVSIVFLSKYWLRKTRKVIQLQENRANNFLTCRETNRWYKSIKTLECSCVEFNFNHLIIAYWILSTIIVEK